jgi:transposase
MPQTSTPSPSLSPSPSSSPSPSPSFSDSQTKIQETKKRKRSVKKRVSDEIRLHFIECALLNGIPAACAQFDIKESTARNWMKLWDPEVGFESIRRIKPGPEPGKRRKLTPEVTNLIDNSMKEDNSLSGKKLAGLVNERLGVKIGASTINAYLASNNYTFKRVSTEDSSRNTPTIIEERRIFAKAMTEQNLRPEDPSSIIYFDVSYIENCIVARRARSKRGTPAVIEKGHRGIYFNKDEREMKKKRKKQIQYEQTEPRTDIAFSDVPPINFQGGKANSLAMWTAISGTQVIVVRTQFRHPSNEDCTMFFQEILDKLEKETPGKGYTFIGDNENIYRGMEDLLLKQKYHHHTLIPNPRYSPFLNAVEYLFNQIKNEIAGQQYKTVGDLLAGVQKAFEVVQPEHLLNYHKTVTHYLLKSLQGEEIHSWRVKLNEKSKAPEPTKQKWDVKHRAIFSTEKKFLDKPLAKDKENNQPRESWGTMIRNGQKEELYPKE